MSNAINTTATATRSFKTRNTYDFKVDSEKAVYSSVEEAFENCGATWHAGERELLTADGKEIKTHKAIIREDSGAVLGIVGKGYEVFQNAETFALAGIMMKEKGAQAMRASQWDGGARVMMQLRLGTGEVGKGDIVENRITIVNGFDGGQSLVVRSSYLRLVCTNGLTSEDKALSVYFRIRHTRNAKDKYNQALQIMGASQDSFKNFLALSKSLTQKVYDKEMVKRFLNDVFGDEKNESTKIRNQKNLAYLKAVHGAGYGDGSLWSLYNGVTEFVDHVKGAKKDEAYALVDGGATIKARALESISKFI